MRISDLIRQHTGVTDSHELEAIETVLRQDIFHSTLDWQTREVLVAGIADAYRLHLDLKAHLKGYPGATGEHRALSAPPTGSDG